MTYPLLLRLYNRFHCSFRQRLYQQWNKGKVMNSIDPPVDCAYDSQAFNLLNAHHHDLDHALVGGQTMGLLRTRINVANGRTVKAILQEEFPPLDQDSGKADNLVTSLFRSVQWHTCRPTSS